MKLGLTGEERERLRVRYVQERTMERVVFAFLPKYCQNTDRYVWLESVITWQSECRFRDGSLITYYKEIV